MSVPKNERLGTRNFIALALLLGATSVVTGAAGPTQVAQAQAAGTFTMSVNSGPVGTLVELSGNVGTGCASGQANEPNIVFRRVSQAPPLEIMYMPVAQSGAWSAKFVIPSYLTMYNTPGQEAVTPGEYEFAIEHCPSGSTAEPFTVTSGSAISPDEFVGMAATRDGKGYWLAQANGGVFSFGDAGFYGSLPAGPGGLGITPSAPIVGISSTPDGGGYWLVGADGGVFGFGDAGFYGSLPEQNVHPVAPVTSIASTPDGRGYWLGAADGGVFAFGDANFYGTADGINPKVALVSLNNGDYAVAGATGGAQSIPSGPGGDPTIQLAATITGAAATPDGGGIWEVGADGGVITIGDAGFYGSLPGEGITPVAPADGIAATPDGHGYWLVARDGGVFAFGDAGFYGSAAPSTSCQASAFSASASQGSGAGGHEAVVVVFTNMSSGTCMLYGYPTTAWFISAGGTHLQAAVTQQAPSGPITTVTLWPGQKAATTVWTDNPGVPPPSSCNPVATSAVAVELPGDATAITAPVDIDVCTTNNNIGTTPITAGTAESPM